MRRALLSLLLLGLATTAARAHFLWLLPGAEAGRPAVRLVFSDSPAPDDADLLKKVAHTRVFAVGADGKPVTLQLTQGKDALVVTLPGRGTPVVGASCRYGILQRGKSEPFFLNYYAKTWLGTPDKRALRPLGEQLALEIVPDEAFRFARVLWKGAPLAAAEVVLTIPGREKRVTIKTDGDGSFALPRPGKPGLYGIRARHIEKKEGEYRGKKYREVRHYTTLTFQAAQLPGRRSSSAPAPARPKEDPAATRLLAEARAARATWEDFPGFTADLEVNVDGRVSRGRLDVSPRGKVSLEGIEDRALEAATRRQFGSVVAHRLPGAAGLRTPCAFADDNADHPLGRAIRVLNDEFHSSYRIRDRQVIVVNRTMHDSRFTITVLENKINEEKQFLPAHYVVNTWDLRTGALKSSQAFHDEWTRIGKYDLPASILVLTATSDGKLSSRRLRLSNHRLK